MLILQILCVTLIWYALHSVNNTQFICKARILTVGCLSIGSVRRFFLGIEYHDNSQFFFMFPSIITPETLSTFKPSFESTIGTPIDRSTFQLQQSPFINSKSQQIISANLSAFHPIHVSAFRIPQKDQSFQINQNISLERYF